MKQFIVLVFNVNFVNPTDVSNLAQEMEKIFGYKVFQMAHLDDGASPFYIIFPTWGETHDTEGT